ncbi:MAG: ABC transporter permease subunit [Oligoflexales bacterium]
MTILEERVAKIEAKPLGPWREFWYFFNQNLGALLGLIVIVLFILVAVFAPILSPYDPTEVLPGQLLMKPMWLDSSSPFVLGTDDLGRDILSRLLFGARVSLGVGFLVVSLSLVVGTTLGLIAGFFGGFWDRAIMRCVDILMALPSILLAIVVVSVLGPSLVNAIIAVSIVAIPNFVRVVRATVMTERVKQYVTASRCYGASSMRLIFLNILPNCMAPIIIQATLGFSDGILNAAALGFLGLGAQPPTPEWGTMLADSRAFIESASWLVTMPGICIILVVLGFNLLGDGLRDAFDPRLRK